jgi:serine/threonine protein phosphatase Stp1
MGVRDTVEVDVIADEIADGDTFLLCSDGLMARVEDPEIETMLAEPDPEQRVAKLVKLTLDRGAPDNVTVVTVNVQPSTLLQFNQPIPMVAR